MYYGDHFLTGQIIEAINPPEDIANYVCKDCEVKYCRSRHDVSTGQFLGFCETARFLVVRGENDEHFLNDGFCEENSKVLYSYYKRRIPNSFAGTLFNRHRLLFETIHNPGHNTLTFFNNLAQARIATSKTILDIYHDKLGTRVASRVAKQLKT